MAAHYSCARISLDPSRIYFITQSQLVAANEESIQSGFSRTLVEELIGQLPIHLKFPISLAWHHVSGEGQENIRLALLIGATADDLEPCTLDVTFDTWTLIQYNR